MLTSPSHRNLPDFRTALRFWWKLGWISFGGTAAHIALMQDELVDKRQWIAQDEFLHALSLCMLLPGPEAQQLAIYLGWKLHGGAGGMAAGIFFILPSMAILLALSIVYVRFGELPWIAAMFASLKPCVLALVLLAIGRVTRRALNTRLQQCVCVGAFFALAFLHMSLPLLLFLVILFGVLTSWIGPRATPSKNGLDMPVLLASLDTFGAGRRFGRILAVGGGLWILPLLALHAFAPDTRFWTQLCIFFTRTAFVTVGGSYTVIPYVAHLAVGRFHWLGGLQMLDGFALAETTPGPLIIVVAFVGFMAAFNHFDHSILLGTIALLVTTFYTFLPCFLLVFAGAPLVEKTYGKPVIASVLRLITALVVAAMLDLTIFLAHGTLFPRGLIGLRELNPLASAWTAVSFVLLQVFKVNPGTMIVLSLLSGILQWYFHFGSPTG